MNALTERAIRTTVELMDIAMTAPEVAAEMKAYKQAMADVVWYEVNGGSRDDSFMAESQAKFALRSLLVAVAALDRAAYAL